MLTLLWLVGPNRLAQAQTEADLLKQGIDLYSQADFKGSIRLLQRARKQAREPEQLARIDLYLGCNQVELSDEKQATMAFRRALEANPALDLPAEHFKPNVVAAFRTVRRSLMGSLQVTANLEETQVVLDGVLVGPIPYEGELPVGKHVVEVRASRHGRRIEEEVLIRAGSLTAVAAQFEVRPGTSRARSGSTPGMSAAAPPDRDSAALRRHKTLWGYGFLGLCGASAITMAVLYGVGFSNGNDAHARYMEATTPELMARERFAMQEAETQVAIGHVFLGVSLAAAGVSLYHLLTRPPEEKPGQSAGLRVVPMLATGHGTLSVAGQF